ncbi:hypothetical protein [Methanoregula sp.]|uniref:hypothetical protein n=1 Tax=Methanoregula sp. TaxID=2052170 RepID=UPI002C730CD9|nr:hypothetical protein [Methanoregula sp.]HVP96161.1 hypothetical protein [Methanoregula sp.]
MKDSLRRIILFIAIVGIGSALIFLDIPLIYMLLLIVGVGFILLLVLGTITIGEIRTAISALNLSTIRSHLTKGRFSKKPEKKPVTAKETEIRKTEKPALKKTPEASRGIKAHLSLLVSSIGSVGKIFTDRSRPKKKIEDIDKLLDHTITEKVTRSSALENAATVPAAPGPAARGGAGGQTPAESGKESDPFLSLSGEELEVGLLDGLDEGDLSAAPSPQPSPPSMSPDTDSGLSMPDLEMPPLPEETADDASAILAAHAEEGAEDLGGLDASDGALDTSLGDLDKINLDEIDLGDDSAMLETPSEPAPVPSSGPLPGSGSLVPATPITPAGGSETGEDSSDISSFAAGTAQGSDDDMLSSLATDIKQVKKEKDVSLLRELKDFKAPATDIEKELSDISEQMNTAVSMGAKKRTPPAMKTK